MHVLIFYNYVDMFICSVNPTPNIPPDDTGHGRYPPECEPGSTDVNCQPGISDSNTGVRR